ncbi:hypothetical protein [Helicobacter cetorum]|uniref:Coiled-coil domain-containing protein n=1 Tax=Helicobacter cetorum (strain ATCC BAA-540 / CCUG 52418 / MIT 99-5656) TaxID=1163745 RepID=I0EST7_HELCM|nr:hypothetical protein [Helicobacter cetorum]AFI05218.1 hypothetical protein HCD_00930 [Helicobacter cetorum MIT 99-5656]AFI06006.1 hypothetical protein HCD_05020 [Helicobacter cetorum MIT 99-5656]
MAEHTDEKLENLFFESKVDFYKYVLTSQNNYLKERLTDKVDKAKSLSEEIHTSKKKQEVETAKAEFLKKHPDADMEDLIEFYNNEIPPKYKKEIDTLEGEAFFEAILTLFEATQEPAQQDKQPQKEQPLPKELQGNGVASTNSALNSSVVNRY